MRLAEWIQHLEGLSRLTGSAVPLLPPDRTLLAGERGEQLLWRACTGEDTAWRQAVRARGVDQRTPLLEPDAYLAIEVWAECELSALHALHRLVRTGAGAAGGAAPAATLRLRLEGALHWHLEHTQPDNSTNRPWALHAFLLLAEARGSADPIAREATLYAETLVHNVVATHARDEPLSRWILADAARELALARAAAASRPSD